MRRWAYLSAVLMIVAVFFLVPGCVATASVPFDDISQAYAQQQIMDLYNRGIIQGEPNGHFAPNQWITRTEFVVLLDRMLHLQPVQAVFPAFADVAQDFWGYGWVQAGTSVDIIKGKDADHFAPNAPITRQEAAALIVRALRLPTPSAAVPYADRGAVSPWALPFVAQAYQSGLMQGYNGYFRPLDPITRQEAAVALDRVVQGNWIRSDSSRLTPIQLGWQYNEDTFQFEQDAWNSATINTLSPRWFFLESNGLFSDHAQPQLVAWAHQHNMKVWVLAGNRFDASTTHQVLSQQPSRDALVNQLSGFARQYQLDGINIDFENINPAERDNFSQFIKSLSQVLHADGIVLSVDVPFDSGSDWSAPYDYKTLAAFADYLVVMGYDEHWQGDPTPGPVSSLPWFQNGMSRLESEVPASKLIAGLPLYSRAWYLSDGNVESYDLSLLQEEDEIQQNRATRVWDTGLGQYVANYFNSGTLYTVWVEDSRSLSLKYRSVADDRLAGYAYWYTGSESQDIWKALQNAETYSREVQGTAP